MHTTSTSTTAHPSCDAGCTTEPLVTDDTVTGMVIIGAKIAPRLKCYKNASRLNRYNFPTDNANDFLFSTLHTTPFHYEVLKIGSR